MRPELQAKFAAAQVLEDGGTELEATIAEAQALEDLGVPIFDETDSDTDPLED